MLGLADTILSMVRNNEAGGLDELPKARLQLAKEVSRHVSEEIALIQDQPGDRGSADPSKKALITRYHDELLAWRAQLNTCNVEWPPQRIRDDRRGFLAMFQPLRDALEKRIRWEEDVFYPGVLVKDYRRQSA